MLVRCETDKGHDDFYMAQFHSLIELKEYAESNSMPIKCKKPYDISSYGNVRFIDEMKEVYLYLNNYLHYYDVTSKYGLMDYKEYHKAYEKLCKNCALSRDGWGCDCTMEDDGSCSYFKEIVKFSFKDVFKEISDKLKKASK